PASPAPERDGGPRADRTDRPRVDFMIVGAQKCGTTALASFLGAHPEIGMAAPKETHLFDDPDYGPRWTRERIDARYAECFRHCPDARLRGEATPVYLYFAETAAELARYNPALKVIVLLREPAERAVSHYHMRRALGAERRPFWLALLLEPFLLLRDRDPRRKDSPTRERAYRARGLYAGQLAALRRSFPAERVLVLRQADLLEDHDAVMRRVFAFLGVDPAVRVPAARVFAGGPRPRHRLARAVLRLSYLADAARLRRLGVRV
ncbi:MAG: sulfotransferase domain-containing protein, partial [Alphaproteobacteria bacterium]|nr:sulfotransferase domain-containing protein [Alphaproteobacteria bacterium]